jgi:uncharacterized protein HemX
VKGENKIPYTEQERKVVQNKMFGCLAEDLDKLLEIPYIDQDVLFMAMSFLSDAQELMRMNKLDAARQTINKAKYMIDKKRTADREAEKKGCTLFYL